ncbi:MAG TPA: hypothetical protein VK175_06365 [Leadbetterella sp.]|nr:hypothetical protein [Leadbetterella sp.]
MSLKSKDFKRVMPLLMALRSYGQDFDNAAVLVERIYKEVGPYPDGGVDAETPLRQAQGDLASVPFAEKMDFVAGLLKDVNKRVVKRIWVWPSWLRLTSAPLRERRMDVKFSLFPKLVWVREEHFANTKAIELSMANVYFLKFAEVAKKAPLAVTTDRPKGGASPLAGTPDRPKGGTKKGDAENKWQKQYEKALGELLGHLVIRKRWNWRKMRLERTPYHSRQVLELGKVLNDSLPEVMKLWLVNYFEEQLKIFIRMFPGVFGPPVGMPHHPNGGAEEGEGLRQAQADRPKGIFPNGQGWIAILEDVALQGVHGDFEKVCDTEAVTIWLFLEHQKIKAEAAK